VNSTISSAIGLKFKRSCVDTMVLHLVAMKYIQHNLHYRPVKQEQGIPNGQEKNFLLQDNYR
jgi:hypothetical protein